MLATTVVDPQIDQSEPVRFDTAHPLVDLAADLLAVLVLYD